MKSVEPTLEVPNLERTIRFYCDTLGFELDLLWPRELPTFCILVRDDIRMMFYTGSERRNPEPQRGGQLRIDMDGVVPLFESIRDRVQTEWGPEVYSYGRREVSIRDCNGYSIILSEKTSDSPTGDVG